jgi:PAS domain-containing protein
MDGKRLYSLPSSVLLGVVGISAIWEFLLEPLLGPLVVEGFVDESITKRWEFVITATAFPALSLVVPTLLLFRAAAQHQRDMTALRGSEQRFRTLFDANPAMLLIVDGKGTILYVNGFVASRLGYAPDEFTGQPISMLHPAETRHDLEAQLARIGGDEFVLLMEHCSLAQAQEVAEDAPKAVRELRLSWEQYTFQLGASAGLVAIDAGSDDPAAVLRAADHACYTAKRQGGSRVQIHRGEPPECNRIHAVRETGVGNAA